MNLTKILMAAGLALTLSASAQDGKKEKGEGRDKRKGGHRDHRGGFDGGMMRGMDPAAAKKQLEELRKKADADGDGQLNGDERRAFFTGMKEAWAKQKEEYMTKWDKNGDGKIDEEERVAIRQGQTDDEFKRMDTNADGVIDKKEFLASKDAAAKARDDMRNTFRGMRGGGRGGQQDEGGKAMIERFDENGDGKVDDNERLKAAQAQLERMERKGLTGEWKKFDKDGNGTLSQAEKDALVLNIAERLKKKTEGGGDKKATKERGKRANRKETAPAE